MGVPQFVDISAFQPSQIDWVAYKAWAAQWDGVARVAMRSSYGLLSDANFAGYRAGALAAGIDQIFFYHYSYPNLNTAIDEANYQQSIVGGIRPQDMLILDYEQQVSQATADWAYTWLAQQLSNYGKVPGIYASLSYIQSRLQDARLAAFPLWLADWQYDPNVRPASPAPWTSYAILQYTDRATNIPGIAGPVDADIFLGGLSMSGVPQGWTDDGQTLTAPNGHKVVLGFRGYILSNQWDPSNYPLEEEHGQSPLEVSNPSLGSGTQQIFRYTALEYTADRGVFVAWIGQELLAVRGLSQADVTIKNDMVAIAAIADKYK